MVLLGLQSEIEAGNTGGETAFTWAARSGCEATIRVLLDRQARIEAMESAITVVLEYATLLGPCLLFCSCLLRRPSVTTADCGYRTKKKDELGRRATVYTACVIRSSAIAPPLDCEGDAKVRDSHGRCANNVWLCYVDMKSWWN